MLTVVVLCDMMPLLFQTWRMKEQEQSERDAEATRAHGKTMVGKPIELQEELLACADGAGPLNQAWFDLIGTAAWLGWKELDMIYSLAKYELRDLELMAAARQAAEDGGDEAHAARVREVMALEEIQSPNWWPLAEDA